jgi:hypothetical protein
VSLVIYTSSTNTQARSLTWCVHRISHRDINPDRIFGASFIARNHPSRRIMHRAVSCIASYSHRAASSSRGILHRAASSSCGIVIARYHPSTNNKVLYIGPLAGLVSKPNERRRPSRQRTRAESVCGDRGSNHTPAFLYGRTQKPRD